jgi:hypothetical protein
MNVKRLALAIVMMIGAMATFASNPVSVKSGDKNALKANITVKVEIDDHNTIIDGRGESADVYYGNQSDSAYEGFIADVDRGHASFITYFNEKKKEGIASRLSSQDGDYTLYVKVESMNVGNAAGVVWGMSRKAGGAVVNGTMKLVKNDTLETVCEYEFAGVKGMLSPKFQFRAISVYRYLADGLLKTMY